MISPHLQVFELFELRYLDTNQSQWEKVTSWPPHPYLLELR